MAVENGVARFLGQVFPWDVQGEAEFAGQAFEQVPVVFRGGLVLRPRLDGAFAQRPVRVGHDELGVDFQFVADAGAGRAGAVRSVEREGARLDFAGAVRVAVGAGAVLGERLAAARIVGVEVDEVGDHPPARQAKSRLHRVRQTLSRLRFDDEPVDNHGDRVLVLLLEVDVARQTHGFAVDECASVAIGRQRGQQLLELAFLAVDDGRQHLEARALRVLQERVDHLLWRLAADRLAAHRAVGFADAGEQQAQVVVDLRDGANGRARVAVRRFLVDRHSRAEALDEVDVRIVHLAEELARIGAQRLHVAALAFGEQRVEGDR